MIKSDTCGAKARAWWHKFDSKLSSIIKYPIWYIAIEVCKEESYEKFPIAVGKKKRQCRRKEIKNSLRA